MKKIHVTIDNISDATIYSVASINDVEAAFDVCYCVESDEFSTYDEENLLSEDDLNLIVTDEFCESYKKALFAALEQREIDALTFVQDESCFDLPQFEFTV